MLLLSLLKILIVVVFFITLTNLKQLIIPEIDTKNQVYKYYFDNLVKAKKLETKNILIDKENYKDLTIYFIRHFHSMAIKMLSLHYHELMEKTEELEEKNIYEFSCLYVSNYVYYVYYVYYIYYWYLQTKNVLIFVNNIYWEY